MTIRQEQFRKRSKKEGAGHAPAMVNVRLRWKGRGTKTAADARAALRELLKTERVPKGWQFAAIQWFHPRKGKAKPTASEDWTEGTIDDFEKFAPLLQHLLERITVGVVE